MAVYTEVAPDEIGAFAARYDVGEVVSCEPIAEGIENSNYRLETARGRFVLTLFENPLVAADLPFFFRLMEHLDAHGIGCPAPIAMRDASLVGELHGRPAALFTFLKGAWPSNPTPAQCAAVGNGLARLHVASLSFPLTRRNDRSLEDWASILSAYGPRAGELEPHLGIELDREMTYLTANWPRGLARGIIHGDLFPDNALFVGDRLSGFIDFYHACNDFFAYDLMIALTAWCFDSDDELDARKARSLMRAYQGVRPLSGDEMDALPTLGRGAAVRFLVTRLRDWLDPPDGPLVRRKDPVEYWKRLQFHRAVEDPRSYGIDPA